MPRVASFAVFFPSLKILTLETDRFHVCCMCGDSDHWVGVRATKSLNKNTTHPHACVTGQAICINTNNNNSTVLETFNRTSLKQCNFVFFELMVRTGGRRFSHRIELVKNFV